jgi:phosphohistidine phosphatase
MRTLYVLRHAKSSWDDASLGDHDRPLTGRGRRAAALIGKHMREEGIRPQLVLCSSATRARQTLDGLGGGAETVEVGSDLYLASGDELTARLRKLEPELASVMVIGHNPGMQDLVVTLATQGADLDRVKEKFPTAALATLVIDGDWSDLGERDARLVALVFPKDLGR